MLLFAAAVLLVPLRWILAWLISVTVHELGHLMAVRVLGIRVHEIQIGFRGAKIHTDPMTAGQEFICALAGPGAGALLLLVSKWLPVTAVCAFFHTLINLLPGRNLDGGRALRCLLRKIPCKQTEEGLQ